jgi:hypothetical protein
MRELDRTFMIDQMSEKLKELPIWQLNPIYATITEAINNRTKCRSCGAVIIWGKTPNGKSCPFDLATGESHFKTCPQAAGWSKKGKPSQ